MRLEITEEERVWLAIMTGQFQRINPEQAYLVDNLLRKIQLLNKKDNP